MEMTKYTDTSGMTLQELKNYRFEEIDKKTEKLIAQGFTYASKQFSLSPAAQINILGLQLNKDVMTYPVEWNTIDDSDKYSITDATDAVNFHLAALTTTKSHLDSGTVLKDQIRAAVDASAVNAIVDNR